MHVSDLPNRAQLRNRGHREREQSNDTGPGWHRAQWPCALKRAARLARLSLRGGTELTLRALRTFTNSPTVLRLDCTLYVSIRFMYLYTLHHLLQLCEKDRLYAGEEALLSVEAPHSVSFTLGTHITAT